MENENKKSLLLVQIGPVQDFISAARSTKDLWSGSYLIAHLSEVGIKNAEDTHPNSNVVFPSLDKQSVYNRLSDATTDVGQPTFPNRFLLKVPSGEVTDLAKKIEEGMREELSDISKRCFDRFKELFPQSATKYEARWNEQVANFLQFTWLAVGLDENDWSGSYQKVLEELAALRNTRVFNQINRKSPPEDDYTKDALNGKDEVVVLPEEWDTEASKNDLFKKNEKPYGAMTIIKRFWGDCFLHANVSMLSTQDIARPESNEAKGYFAVIAMDGDKMGSRLSEPGHDGNYYRELSKNLATINNSKIPELFKEHAKWQLIYAGGDDVLAMVPASEAIECAYKIRNMFCNAMNEWQNNCFAASGETVTKPEPFTASVGIAVGHCKSPLQLVIETARQAEHKAKNDYDRDAFVIIIDKRSGETLEFGSKFEAKTPSAETLSMLDLFNCLTDLRRRDVISSRFAHALAQLLYPYGLDNENCTIPESDFKDVMEKEFLRVLERQEKKKASKEDGDATSSHHYIGINERQKAKRDPQMDVLCRYGKLFLNSLAPEKFKNFAKLFLCFDFLTRKD